MSRIRIVHFSASQNCVFPDSYSAIEASRRKKHSPLNSYVSLYDMTEEKEPLINTMEAHKNSNPEELLVSQEYAELLFFQNLLRLCFNSLQGIIHRLWTFV